MKNWIFILAFAILCSVVPFSQTFSSDVRTGVAPLSVKGVGVQSFRASVQDKPPPQRVALAQQDIFKIKLEVKTEKDIFFLKEIGLDCPKKGECICEATIAQMNKLRAAHYPYATLKQRRKIENERAGSCIRAPSLDSIFASNGNNYHIHDFDTTYSNINIDGLPVQAIVRGIDVRFDIIHSRLSDLVVDLTGEDVFYTYNLWDREGDGEGSIHYTETDIWRLNLEPVNQIWTLRVYDAVSGDTGYIDFWGITIWYEAPSDLILQSLTPSNYNPTVGEGIDVTMIIKNQGQNTAWDFWTTLFFNESPPSILPRRGNLSWYTKRLDPEQTESHTLTEVTSSDSGIWHMYGLTDPSTLVPETNEDNNVKGPVNVQWHAPTLQPDLVIQSLTPSNFYPIVGGSISVTMVLENLGNGDASFFLTNLFKNLTSLRTIPSTGDYDCRKSLAAGEQDSCTFNDITSTTPGTWYMYGLIDSYGEVSESNKDNNVRGPVNIYWQSTQEKPDLIVDDFCIGNNDPEVGDSVHVMVTIKNQGKVTVPGFFCSLFYNKSSPPTPAVIGNDSCYVASLSPGERFSCSFYIGNEVAEYWSMYSLVDSRNSINESNEDNNLYGPHYVNWSYPRRR